MQTHCQCQTRLNSMKKENNVFTVFVTNLFTITLYSEQQFVTKSLSYINRKRTNYHNTHEVAAGCNSFASGSFRYLPIGSFRVHSQ